MISSSHCKVSNCDQNHSQHYCRLCEDKDSSHFARDCPQGCDLYHVTRVSSLSPISLQGLKPSSDGRLGRGVYFTTKQEAFKVAEIRGSGQGIVVLKCRVNLGSCKNYGGGQGKGWAMQGYNSARSSHPPWGCIKYNFPQWVLKDPRKLRISEVHMIGGTINGVLNLPRVDIFTSGTCKFTGCITAGCLMIGGDVTIG